MIDPIQSLAFSIQANPGVYALLLGSGVSRSAGIPTGWEIVNDLLGKLAASQGQSSETDLVQWYVDQYGEEPDYSKLLDGLAKTQSERQQLLRPYFEPTEEEREEGLKQPTAAHKAIAQLVAQGYVKVIVTTNFDRLIERALEDAGIAPTVLSSPDHVRGALPLVHQRCCVIKLHGDYLDTRIRNSSDELSAYPKEFNVLLNRVLDEFGLVVCGWSAEWDEALRKAFLRAKSKRFTTYWALRGEAGDSAQQVIRQRDAQVIPITGADEFFTSIQETVQSIEEYSRPHPLSIEAAAASMRRYLSKPEYRIQLKELVDSTVEQAVENTRTEFFNTHSPEPDLESIAGRLHSYETACATLLSIAPAAGMWAEQDNFLGWEQAIQRLSRISPESGNSFWLHMQTYPGMLLMYALGLGMVELDRLALLNRILSMTDSGRFTDRPIYVLHNLLSNSDYLAKNTLKRMDNRLFPRNDWLHDVLRPHMRAVIPDDVRYDYIFDKFEMLFALAHGRLAKQYWFPPGAYYYRETNGCQVVYEIEESISALGVQSPYVQSGLMGATPEECSTLLIIFKRFIREHAITWTQGQNWYDCFR